MQNLKYNNPLNCSVLNVFFPFSHVPSPVTSSQCIPSIQSIIRTHRALKVRVTHTDKHKHIYSKIQPPPARCFSHSVI